MGNWITIKTHYTLAMEYSSTTNNWAFVTHFPELDVKDAVIVDFLSRYAQSPYIQKKVCAGKVFYWFSYDKISEELPLLKIEGRRVRSRVAVIIKAGILEAHPENSGGKTFFAFGPRYPLTHARATDETSSEKGQGLDETSSEKGQGQEEPRPKKDKGLAKKGQGLGKTSSKKGQQISIPLSDIPLSVPPTTDEVEENAQARKNSPPSESETSDLREEIPPSPPSSAAPPASPANGGWRPFDMAAEAELMKNDHRVEYLFARDCKVKKPDVPALLSEALTEFLLKQEAIAHTYNNATEFRKHFFLWAALVVVDGKIVYPSSSRSPQPAYGQPAPPPSKVVFGKPSYPNVPTKVTFR